MDNPSEIALSHRHRVHQLWDKYDASIASGRFYPFGYPFGLLVIYVPLVYFLLPRTRFSDLGRILVWLLVVSLCVYGIAFTRARNASTSYGVGLVHGWLLLWATSHFLVNDAKADYARIKNVGDMKSSRDSSQDGRQPLANGDSHGGSPRSLRRREGFDNLKKKANAEKDGACDHGEVAPIYAWERHPNTLLQRFSWTQDLLTTYDGMGWNWAVSTLPLPPKAVEADLSRGQNGPRRNAAKAARKQYSKEDMLKRDLRRLGYGYVLLDVIKTLMAHDAYFWGKIDHPGPFYIPANMSGHSRIVRAYRLVMGFMAIYTGLQFSFALRSVAGVFLLGEKRFGARGEAWHYPDDFGSFRTVLDRGLAGFWGQWWHQAFRFVFETPTRGLLRILGLNGHTYLGQAVRLFTVFALSGFLHACGSYTAVGDTHPVTGSFVFFIFQAFGIVVQLVAATAFLRSGVSKHVPTWLSQLSNVVFCFGWLYITSPVFINDLARAGALTYEPVPISILRGVGLGGKHEGWWAWHGRWISWNTQGHWLHWGIVS
jgi:hypothetical protein